MFLFSITKVSTASVKNENNKWTTVKAYFSGPTSLKYNWVCPFETIAIRHEMMRRRFVFHFDTIVLRLKDKFELSPICSRK